MKEKETRNYLLPHHQKDYFHHLLSVRDTLHNVVKGREGHQEQDHNMQNHDKKKPQDLLIQKHP